MRFSNTSYSNRQGNKSHSKRSYLANRNDWEITGSYLRSSLFCAFVVQIIYAYTVNPTIVGGDNGEVISNTIQLGITHSPGYPLLTVVGHLVWRLFSWTGNPALVLNLLSTFFAAGAAFFLSATIYYLTNGDEWSAIISTLLLSFGETFWIQSVQFEVFTLNNLFICVVLFLTVRFYYSYWREETSKLFPIALWGAFISGLSLSNQHTIVFYLIPIILCILYVLHKTHQLTVTRFFQLAGLFVLGLLPYTYLVIASYFPKKGSWGDARTLYGLLNHLLRLEYGTFRLFAGDDSKKTGEMFASGLMVYFVGAWKNFLGVGFLLSLFGMADCFASQSQSQRKEEKEILDRRNVIWLVCGVYVMYIIVFHYLANLPISSDPLFVNVQMRFWMQGFLVVAVFMGVGFTKLSRTYPQFRQMLCIAGIGCVVIQFLMMYPRVVPLTRDNETLLQLGHSQLDVIPQDSIYLVFGDCQQNSVLYLQQCLHEREDVDVVYLPYASYMWYNYTQIPLYPNITWPGTVYHELGSMLKGEGGNAFNLKEFFNANLDKRRIFITSWISEKDHPTDEFMLFPIGVINEVKRKGSIPDRSWVKQAIQGLQMYNLTGNYPVGTWEEQFVNTMWKVRLDFVEFLLADIDQMSLNDFEKRYYLRYAEQLVTDYLRERPVKGPEYYLLGVIYQHYRDLEPKISNIIGFSTCVMIDALQKYVKMSRVKSANVEKSKQLINFFSEKCVDFWSENPDMRIDMDHLPYSIPDYTHFEQYL